MEATQSEEGVVISQKKCTFVILDETRLENCKLVGLWMQSKVDGGPR